MNKLKDLISQKSGTTPPLTTGNVKEVPEDVLKKLLEDENGN